MARLPSSIDLSGPASLRSGRAIASYDTSGIGRGLANLGADVASVSLKAMQARKQADDVQQGSTADGLGLKGISDLARSFNNDADYATFQTRFEKGAQEIVAKAAQHISDPQARQRWVADFTNRRVIPMRDRVLNLAQTGQREHRKVNQRHGLEGYRSVMADTTATEEERQYARLSAEAAIDFARNAGDLTPEEADRWRREFVESGDFIYGEREVQAKGTAALSDRVADSVVDQIIHVESGGDPHAENPASSATGLGQFTESTWIGTVKKHEPGLMEGRSKAELLALRKDPAISRRMVANLVEDNRAALQSAGVPVNDGTLYLAHFAGAGGAVSLLKADPNASAESVLGAKAVAANPFLQGKTAADVIAWAGRKMGGDRPEWFTRLPPDSQFRLEQMAVAQDSRMDTARAAQDKANRTAIYDDFRLRIASADASLTRNDILSNPVLDAGDKATLLTSWEAKMKDTLDQARAVQLFSQGGLTVDPYSTEGRKAVDAVGDYILANADPEQQSRLTEELVRQSGIVPQRAFNAIRAGLESTNVADVVAAAQTAQRIAAIDRAALGRRDGGSGVQTLADDFEFMVNTQNMDPNAAAQRIIDRRDPEKQFQRKALEPAAKEFLKSIEAGDHGTLAGQFDTWFGWEPDVGFSPGQELGIMAEYMAIAEEQFYAANGDTEIAKNRAMKEMQRLYGVTTLTGRKVLMKHPPERYWPQFPDADDAVSYPAQLQEDIRALFPDADMGSVQLVTTPETDAMVKRGEAPGYAVLYMDEDGVLQAIPGKLWKPDFERMRESQKAFEGDRVEGAQRQRERILWERDLNERADRAAEEALQGTEGPDWMKARAAEAARERVLDEAPPAVPDEPEKESQPWVDPRFPEGSDRMGSGWMRRYRRQSAP